MRQTSRAVALLLALESANAALTAQVPATTYIGGDYATQFDPIVSVEGAPDNSLQLNNRNAGYTNVASTFASPLNDGTNPTWGTVTYRKTKVANNTLEATATVVVAGSGCMQCLNGGGVWCSRTFSHLSTSSTNKFMADGLTAASISTVLPVSAAATVFSDALDGGACCDTAANFNLLVGTKAIPVRASPAANDHTASIASGGVLMVPTSCPALKSTYVTGTGGPPATSNTNAFGQAEIDNATTALSGWWCSNGLYKKIVSAGVMKVNSQQTIAMSQNKRLELAQVGCPNASVMCNTGSTVAVELTNASASLAKRDIVMPQTAGMTSLNKCTWVTWSAVAGPSWSMKANGTAVNGLTGANWQIHAMEYTASAATTFSAANGSLVPGAVGGIITLNEGLAFTNMTPMHSMPADQFATLRTWYGVGALTNDTITGQASTWLSPGMSPLNNTNANSTQLAAVMSQLYGNVANVASSGNVANTNTTTNMTATQNYGTVNSVVFDLRQMRYFPAKVAQNSHAAGVTAAASYTTALSSYNTAKTTWDAYVAILEKNAKQDAFAALFSPPKAPTVPPLPNKPWLPAGYSGYTRATALEVSTFAANNVGKVAASPTASQVWTNLSAAQTVGGWGSFTAQIFTYRTGWGKSFGTIGYDGTTTNQSMSDVWNYKWTCIATTNAVSATSQCAPTYSITTPGLTLNTAAAPAINSIKMIAAVSLWSTAASATSSSKFTWGTTLNGLAITFTAGAWTSGIVGLTPLAAPTAAVAAKSLSGIAGAQALVASSAAALAVAAALY